MDIPWGSSEAWKFVNNVGLITSNGPHGNNIMAAEWTHHMSYSPGLVMVNIGFNKATETNIKKSGEFGVNLAAADQNVLASISGGSTGKEIDKIAVLREMGVEFYNGKKINALMLKGAALNVECRLIKAAKMGDHTMFIGEALSVHANEKEPLVYSHGKYWRLTENVQKPPQDVLDKIHKIIEQHRKK